MTEPFPATRGMLENVRRELKSDVSALHHGMKSGLHEVKSEIHGMKSSLDKIMAAVSQMQIANEQQADNNRLTLEAISDLKRRN